MHGTCRVQESIFNLHHTSEEQLRPRLTVTNVKAKYRTPTCKWDLVEACMQLTNKIDSKALRGVNLAKPGSYGANCEPTDDRSKPDWDLISRHPHANLTPPSWLTCR